MRLLLTLGIAAGALVAAIAMGGAGPAAAHPLGNFTINHYTRIDISGDGIEVYRVLDMAEIPAFQELRSVDADGDRDVSLDEAAHYVVAKGEELRRGMTLLVDGETIALGSPAGEVTFPEGQGGLSLLRLTLDYRAPLPDGWQDGSRVEFTDDNYADRLGWREVVLRAGSGVELAESSVPATDVSNELLTYPEALSSPLDVRSATAEFRAGAGAPLPQAHPKTGDAVRGNPDASLGAFTSLIAKDDLTIGVIIAALLTAMAFGALHALSPGHGKTVVAAYLVGSRGTAWHALLLAGVVTLTHTSSVYLVGFATLYLSAYILPEDLYPWLSLASGGLILLMGATLLVSRLRSSGFLSSAGAWLGGRLRPSPRASLAFAVDGGADLGTRRALDSTVMHSATHGDRAHEHPHHHDAEASHQHGFGATHNHHIPGQDGEPVTLRSLIGLGVFGGMIPCPSALVVMFSAIALHRVGFGLVLIAAFSLGLAVVLTGIGFALLAARSLSTRMPALQRIGERAQGGGMIALAVRAVPVLAAVAVVAAGLVITLRGVAQV